MHGNETENAKMATFAGANDGEEPTARHLNASPVAERFEHAVNVIRSLPKEG